MALVLTAATLALCVMINGWSGSRPVLMILLFPTIFAAFLGGLGPGLTATIFGSIAARYLLIPPMGSFHVVSPVDEFRWTLLLILGVLVSGVSEAWHRARRRDKRTIAQLRAAQAALDENDALFEKVFKLSPDCVALVRLSDRVVLKANEAIRRLWGSVPEDVIGRPTRDYTSWQNEEERTRFMRVLQEQGEYLNYETNLWMNDGRLVPFSISTRLIQLEGENCILSVLRDITERRKAEVATHMFAAIVGSSEDAIVGKTLDGIVTAWNDGAEKIFGYTATEMMGHSIRRIVPPDRMDEEVAILAAIARGEHLQHFETVRMRKDGTHVHVSETISPITNGQGQVIGASKIARDITAQKHAEIALRESNARFASIFNSSPIATTLTVVADGRYLDVNDAFLKMFGRGRDEVVGRTVADLDIWIDPDRREVLFAVLQRDGEVRDFEMRLRAKSGSTIHLLWSGVQILIDGTPCLLGSGVDITARKHAEDEIRRLNADLEQRVAARTKELADLYNQAPCGYHSLDADGRFLGINDTELAWLGYVRQEIVGKMVVTDLLSPASVNVFRESFPVFKSTGRLNNLEMEFVRKDGTILPVLLSATIATGPDGEFLHSRSTMVDYTDRRQAAHALQASQVRLEALNRELEAFTYSVSHDLRAPLRAVDGFSQAVIEDFGGQLPAEGQRQLRTIRESAQRMGTLIDDLLAFSRLSRRSLSRQAIEMESLVRSSLADLAPEFKGRNVELTVGSLPPCEGDSALLKQVWINLLSNALKYTRGREKSVIEVGATRSPEGWVNYFVRDNGAGFDMKYATKLFGVFQRLHRAEEFEGTGVGLAIVHRIIERHEGRVWAEAAVDLGATFFFTLNGGPNT